MPDYSNPDQVEALLQMVRAEAQPEPASTAETVVDLNPPVSNSSDPINFEEPRKLEPLPETIEVAQEQARPVRPDQTWTEKKAAIDNEIEREKREFYEKIMAARQPPPPPPPTPPVAPRVQSQTEAEMEAGRAMVARHEHQRIVNPPPPPETEGRSIPVFSPENYVPDPRKGQGLTPTTTYRVL